MSFDGTFMDASPLGHVPAPIHLVVVDLCAGKNTSVILNALQRAYPAPKTELDELVHRTLGVENLEITGLAVKALLEGDAKRLGELMSQVRFFDQSAVARNSGSTTLLVKGADSGFCARGCIADWWAGHYSTT